MPYIQQKSRSHYDEEIEKLIQKLTNYDAQDYLMVGELNYVISSMIWKLFDKKPSYTRANELEGVLACVSKEFYRRKVAPLEEIKIKENGDL